MSKQLLQELHDKGEAQLRKDMNKILKSTTVTLKNTKHSYMKGPSDINNFENFSQMLEVNF